MSEKRSVEENHDLICQINDKLLGRIEKANGEIANLKQEIAMLEVDLMVSGHKLTRTNEHRKKVK